MGVDLKKDRNRTVSELVFPLVFSFTFQQFFEKTLTIHGKYKKIAPFGKRYPFEVGVTLTPFEHYCIPQKRFLKINRNGYS